MLKIWNCPLFADGDNSKLAALLYYAIRVRLSVKLLMGFLAMWNPNLALLSQPEVTIPSEMGMLELFCVVKQQDFLSSGNFHIKNESKVDEINIKVKNRTQLNHVGYESNVNRIYIYTLL